tara:strand:- start:205 stop:618 length:414 start_codon:yes stop_codon:yes gene_type:complete
MQIKTHSPEKEFTYEYVLTLHREPDEGFIVDLRIDKCGTDGDVFDSEYEEGFIFDTYKEAFAKYAELYVRYDGMEGELQPENRYISDKINNAKRIKAQTATEHLIDVISQCQRDYVLGKTICKVPLRIMKAMLEIKG